MRSGELAEQTGVHLETLRYYERCGLLRPKKRPSGYREYTETDAALLRFIKHTQQLGFSLTEIQELLRLQSNKRASCQSVRTKALAKLTDIELRIARLQAIKGALELLVKTCERKGNERECPLFDVLHNERNT